MRLSDLLNEITLPATNKSAAVELGNHGYSKIGAGSFAQVMAKPDSPYVVKLFRKDDAAYLAYLHLIQTHRNEHFPIIYGKPVLIKDRLTPYYAVRVEKLVPLKTNPNYDIIIDDLVSAKYHLIDYGTIPVEFYEKHPSLAQAMYLIYTKIVEPRHGYFDIKVENIMLRGSTIVLADPVA